MPSEIWDSRALISPGISSPRPDFHLSSRFIFLESVARSCSIKIKYWNLSLPCPMHFCGFCVGVFSLIVYHKVRANVKSTCDFLRRKLSCARVNIRPWFIHFTVCCPTMRAKETKLLLLLCHYSGIKREYFKRFLIYFHSTLFNFSVKPKVQGGSVWWFLSFFCYSSWSILICFFLIAPHNVGRDLLCGTKWNSGSSSACRL